MNNKPRFDFTLTEKAAESFFKLLEEMREISLRRITKTDFVKICLIEGMETIKEKMNDERRVML